MAKAKYIENDVRLSIELYHEGDGFGIYLGDYQGGSGIQVSGDTPQEAAENLAPYIADYFYKNEE